MRFEDERYVRDYTRDTTTIMMLSWEARALMREIRRKVDRAGLLDLGEDGLEALAITARMPLDVVERAMPELIKRGVFELHDDGMLICPKFIEAQEATSSDRARAKAYRERARDTARSMDRVSLTTTSITVTKRDESITICDATVTNGDETVTHAHDASRAVTLCCAVPSHTVPSEDSTLASLVTPSAPSARKRADSGTRLDSKWEPSDACRTLCKSLGLNLAHELELFRGYWCPLPGVRAKKLDWNLTFQTRLREQAGRAMRPSGGRPQLAPVAKSPTHREFVPSPPFLFDENPALNGKGH